MNDYILSPRALRIVEGSSKGTQPKYFENNFWYKANNKGYEGISEYLVSKILEKSNVKKFVRYEQCDLSIHSNGKEVHRKGCCSENFTKENESFISFERLHTIYVGIGMQEVLQKKDKNRALEVLQYQLKQYRNIIMPDKDKKRVKNTAYRSYIPARFRFCVFWYPYLPVPHL